VLVAEARDRGDPWVILHETGSPDRTGFRRLEMHLASGAALHLFIDPDPTTGRPEYSLQQLRLDPSSGDYDSSSPIEEARAFDDAAAWQRAVDEVRRYLEGE
jgi:hypothetical protein